MTAPGTYAEECILCRQTHTGSVFYGELLNRDDIFVHEFCLLFCTSLYADESKNDEDDATGNALDLYDLRNVRNTAEKIFNQKCIFCEGDSASIKCHMKSCSRRFHFKCAFDSEKCSLKFHELYHAMCPSHTIRSRLRPKDDETCVICLMELGPPTICGQINLDCRPHVWMHRSCVIQLADSRGYAFQCPVCGESKKFQKYIRLRGVFIPQRDTLTQAHNLAYQETQTKYCEAEICFKSASREKIVQEKMLGENVGSVKCDFCGKFFHSECGAKQGTFKGGAEGEENAVNNPFTCSSCMNLSDHELSVSTGTDLEDLNKGFDYGSDGSGSPAAVVSQNTDMEDRDSESQMTKRFKFDNHYEWKPCKGYHNKEWRQFKLNMFMNTLRPVRGESGKN